MQDLHNLSDESILQEIERRFKEKNASIDESEFLNKKLIDLNQRLIEVDSVKSEFLSLIKNEFNNPISSVLNICSIVLSGKRPEKTTELVEMLHMEILRLDFQIKNIIAASEIEAGKTESYYTKINFESILSDAKSAFIYLIKDKNLNIVLQNDCNEKIISDASKLYLIISNLLSNACEYTYPDKTITVRLNNDDKKLYIEVEDEGEGISVENKMLVYNRFSQFNQGVNRAKTGLGLGLSVVKGEVEALDGTIDYDSEHGKTVFKVEIPLANECEECGSGGGNDILFEDFDDAFEM